MFCFFFLLQNQRGSSHDLVGSLSSERVAPIELQFLKKQIQRSGSAFILIVYIDVVAGLLARSRSPALINNLEMEE